MANEITLPNYTNENGVLAVIENIFPTDIKRIFFIYDVGEGIRGGHRHKLSTNALVCLNGSCIVDVISDGKAQSYTLDAPTKCLLLQPNDYRKMHLFSPGAVLLVASDTHYDAKDYIFE